MRFLKVKRGTLRGEAHAPPSKSYTHRALILGFLANGRTILENPLISEDTLSTVQAIELLGGQVYTTSRFCRVDSSFPNIEVTSEIINVRNSGTTMRLLTGVAGLFPWYTVLLGDRSIRRRPIEPLLEALRELGAWAQTTRGTGCPPVIVRGPLTGQRARIRGDLSSQFVSALLIATPLNKEPTTLEVVGERVSAPYLQVTLELVRRFGGKVEETESGYQIQPMESYRAAQVRVPGDFSSASVLLVGAAASGGEVRVTGLDREGSQGDRAILDILREFEAHVEVDEDTVTVGGGFLKAHDVDCRDNPDLFPPLAVLATQAEGKSTFFNVKHLIVKESDRLGQMAHWIRAMGGKVGVENGKLWIQGPSKLTGTEIECENDHRIFMAGVLLGLLAEGETKVSHPFSYAISYPTFLDDLRRLGGEASVVA